jgi:hypothetical protein
MVTQGPTPPLWQTIAAKHALYENVCGKHWTCKCKYCNEARKNGFKPQDAV